MFVAMKSIPVQHRDLIHDVAYDSYGKRLATCSSDQTVKVWDLDSDGEWKLTCSWRAHNGSIWRLAWAHPEFGQILATCSFDRSVCIWEEVTTTAPSAGVGVASIGIGGGGSGGRPLTTTTFEKRAHLVESALSVTGIHRAFHPTLIAAGCSDAGATDAACKDSFQVYELQEDSRKFAKVESVVLPKPDTGVNDLQFAPSLGRSFHLLAVASQQISLYKLRLSTGGQQQQQQSGGMLLQASQSSSSLDVGSSSGSTGRYALSCIRILEYQRCQMSVWRLSWNVLGTVLASSLEDGTVRLWQGNYADQWKVSDCDDAFG
uniref:WD_REPEATS_REGION domain-containing protein n=1 Tax=Macrostomum lignano TaxID=282301 RepID=A0A1I8IA50_9PLAT